MIVFTKIKHLRTFIEQNTFISNHLNDMRSPYSGESILFVRCQLSYVRFFCLLYRNGHYWEKHSPFPYVRLQNGKTVKTGLLA